MWDSHFSQYSPVFYLHRIRYLKRNKSLLWKSSSDQLIGHFLVPPRIPVNHANQCHTLDFAAIRFVWFSHTMRSWFFCSTRLYSYLFHFTIIIMVDFPSPGSPCSNVIFPTAMNGYHNQWTEVACTSLYNVRILFSTLSAIVFPSYLQSFPTSIIKHSLRFDCYPSGSMSCLLLPSR